MRELPGDCVAFDHPDYVGVERGLTEFRAGRPVVLRAFGQGYLVLPVDGLDARRLSVFLDLCSPDLPQLVITRRRARAMNMDAAGPVAMRLPAADLELISALVAQVHNECAIPARPVDPGLASALELAKLAQRLPAVLAIAEPPASKAIFDPPIVAVEAQAVGGFRRMAMRSVGLVGEAAVQLESMQARFLVFRSTLGDSIAVVIGEPDPAKAVPVRLHSACLTGDVFGSRRCDCGDQLQLALAQLADAGGGIILYLDQEGRGLGLANKIRAYRLQDAGLDTMDADMSLGFDDDERDYGIAAQMLELLGYSRVELLTNNPAKVTGLAQHGIEIAGRRPLFAPVNGDNRRYLTTKALRAGHALDYLLQTVAGTTPT
jgi:GTP cyclohydrolase II